MEKPIDHSAKGMESVEDLQQNNKSGLKVAFKVVLSGWGGGGSTSL